MRTVDWRGPFRFRVLACCGSCWACSAADVCPGAPGGAEHLREQLLPLLGAERLQQFRRASIATDVVSDLEGLAGGELGADDPALAFVAVDDLLAHEGTI
jgi:hypothetical protein